MHPSELRQAARALDTWESAERALQRLRKTHITNLALSEKVDHVSPALLSYLTQAMHTWAELQANEALKQLQAFGVEPELKLDR